MIYAIVGPTGVGKTSFSVQLAKVLNAPILNCDSMQIYKELKIGVAKIKESEKEGIPHYLFDTFSIFDNVTVYDYQQKGRKILNELLKQYQNVVIVGGTGLYLKALLYNFTFAKDNKDQNNELKRLYDFKIIGLTKEREKLYELINKRVDLMMEEGLLDEVKSFYKNNVRTRAITTAIGYKELYEYLDCKVTLEEAIANIKQNSRRYAKRQFTFFRHQFDSITWFDVDKTSIAERINIILNKKEV